MAKKATTLPGANEAAESTTKSKSPLAGFTLKPSRQTCAILGGVTGAVLLSAVGLYVWQSGEIAAIEQKATAKDNEVASGEKVAMRLTSAETEYNDMASKLRYLETSVTAGEYVPSLLKQTEGLAKSVNLKVASVRPTLEPAPEPPADKEARKKFQPWPYDKLHVDMEVSGSYWNVAKMLYRLTEFPKILAVETVQVTPVAGSSTGIAKAGSPSLNVKLKLTGFIFPGDGTGAIPLAPPAAPAGTTGATTPGTTAKRNVKPTTFFAPATRKSKRMEPNT